VAQMTQAAGAAVARDVDRLAASDLTRSPSAVRRLVGRLGFYGRLFRLSCHVRLGLANTISGLFPNFVSGAIRGRLYRWAGFSIGSGAFIMGNLELSSAMPDFYDKLRVGSGTTIADHVSMVLDAVVSIGTNVAIAPHVLICTGNHRTGPGSMRLGPWASSPVTIEDGAWVRLGAIIAPGVTVGQGSVVAAGAVVLKDVPPNTYVEGNPAHVVRRLPWGER
jgi:acetyltransferase-like isoleucine patch superfamily enzyme